jgi:hypothetical protein
VTTPKTGDPSTFAPATPLLVFPLPARVGEGFSSSAVDPATFESMSFSNATVENVQRVDACGDLVEGWGVKGSFQYVAPSGDASTFTYGLVVVPQLGAILAKETIELPDENTPGVRGTWTIGQLKPKAAP